MTEIRHLKAFKRNALPASENLVADALYFIKADGQSNVEIYLTNNLGVLESSLVGFNLSIGSVSTGEPGTDVVVTADLAGNDVTLNFTIPQGDVGPQGNEGQLSSAESYSGLASYELNDLAIDQNALWQAKLPTTGNAPPTLPTTENTHWRMVLRGLEGEANLPAILSDIAKTATAVGFYDSSLDSDGGAAWRNAKGSYTFEPLNTAIRGSRQDNPSKLLIVAEADKLTLYDLDGGAPEIWMVFNVNFGGATSWNMIAGGGAAVTISSVDMKQGALTVGLTSGSSGAGGAPVINFLSEGSRNYRIAGSSVTTPIYNGNIAQRNDGLGYSGDFNALAIAGGLVNDVAMTVLPDAPVDPATGIQVPTIAVATDAGCSVINDDGSVTDSSSLLIFQAIKFDDQGNVFYSRTPSTHQIFMATPADYRAGGGWGDRIATGGDTLNADFYLRNRAQHLDSDGSLLVIGGFGSSVGHTFPCLQLVHLNYEDLSKSLSALITSNINTGWMSAVPALCTLVDTTTGDLVGGDIALNGTFDTDASGWTSFQDGVLSSEGGRLKIENGSGASGAGAQAMSSIAGQTYVASIENFDGVNGFNIVRVGNASFGDDEYFNGVNLPDNTKTTVTFEALSNTTTVTLYTGTTAAGSTSFFDNISVRVGLPDYSPNQKGLVIEGTLTRTPVAPGAEMVSFGGWSGTNFAEQHYNPELNFGTGDFHICLRAKADSNTDTQSILWRTDATASQIYFQIVRTGNTSLVFRVGGTTNQLTVNNFPPDEWLSIICQRVDGVIQVWINKVLVGSIANTQSVDATNGFTRIGAVATTVAQNFFGELASLRIGGGALTEDQIQKICNDEEDMFLPDTAVTLAGTDDQVQAVAIDKVTKLAHAGTPDGMSTFKGLIRVSEDAVPVNTGIKAHNGLIVRQ